MTADVTLARQRFHVSLRATNIGADNILIETDTFISFLASGAKIARNPYTRIILALDYDRLLNGVSHSFTIEDNIRIIYIVYIVSGYCYGENDDTWTSAINMDYATRQVHLVQTFDFWGIGFCCDDIILVHKGLTS